MNCQQTRRLLGAHTDGQLDLVSTVEIESHLSGCPACGREYENQQALRRIVRDAAPYHRAPDTLRRQVSAALPRTGPVRSLTTNRWRWLAVAAVLALAFTGTLRFWGVPGGGNERLDHEILAGHLRSLMGQHLTDITSTDQHNVKPWFAGKLDFSPPVKDLTASGFVLAGGRLDYLDHHPAAALVYRRRQHVINLYIWPDASASRDRQSLVTRQGYHVIRWTQAGMQFAAVSDLNPAELEEFIWNYRAEPSSKPQV